MIKNYFKVAWRKLKKNRFYAIINITGLTIGIVSCLLIGIYVSHELSFDSFNTNADNIVRVGMEYNFGGNPQKIAVTGTKVGPQFKRSFPQVVDYVRLQKRDAVVNNNGLLFKEKRILYADGGFFNIFSFGLISGSAKTALAQPGNMVITQTMAAKYFGRANPVGKSLKVDDKSYIVSAVAADAPGTSQVQFDFVIPFGNLNAAKRPETYSEANYNTYLLLRPNTSIVALQKRITAFIKATEGKDEKPDRYTHFFIEPLKSIHLHTAFAEDSLEPVGNVTYIYILIAVGILIMAIACVNYVNLSIAQAANHSAEIGVRKVMGAARFQLFRQFISESFLLTALSVILAYALAFLLLGFFNGLSGIQFKYSVLVNPVLIVFLVITSVIIAFAAGFYPALLLSGVKIISILKSGFSFTSGKNVRGSLIVFQFVISVFLLIATVIILQQLAYIRNKNIGYNKSNVVVVPVDYTINSHVKELKKAISSLPGVLSVAAANNEPVDVKWGDAIKTAGGKGLTVNALPMDEDFIKTMQLNVAAGRGFEREDVLKTDTTQNYKNFRYTFMLNESAAKALGWTPEQAVGKQISKNYDGTVIGVLKDFNFKSFHEQIGPLLIFLDHDETNDLFIRVSGNNTAAVIAALKATWNQRISGKPFEYKFLDDEFDALYRTEERTAGMFGTFSALTIILACLGLFAVTAYTVVQRTKEIGIRKVLGATYTNIIVLICRDFLKLVVIAAVIASPVAWYLAQHWLQSFAYRIQIQWWIFVMAAGASLIVAGLTVSIQAFRAADANPVESLKSE